MRKLLVALTAVGALLAGSALAQNLDQQNDWCQLIDEHGKWRPVTTPDLALSACTAIIQSGKESGTDLARAFDNRGDAYYAKHQFDRAITDYDEAVRLEPDFARAIGWRGTAYAAEGRYDRAIQDLDQAIRLDPSFVDALIGRGVAYGRKGQYDRAIQDCDQAIRLDPYSVLAFADRGFAYEMMNQYDRAIQDLDQAIRLDPKSVQAFGNRGIARLFGGNASEAADDLAQVMQLRPDAYGVLWLDIARRHAGQDDKAELARNFGRLVVPDRWPAPIAAFYLGKTTREAVYAAANQGGDDTARANRLCQADFFIAENELSNGVRAAAHALLQRAVDRCPPRFFEGWAARAELARLGR